MRRGCPAAVRSAAPVGAQRAGRLAEVGERLAAQQQRRQGERVGGAGVVGAPERRPRVAPRERVLGLGRRAGRPPRQDGARHGQRRDRRERARGEAARTAGGARRRPGAAAASTTPPRRAPAPSARGSPSPVDGRLQRERGQHGERQADLGRARPGARRAARPRPRRPPGRRTERCPRAPSPRGTRPRRRGARGCRARRRRCGAPGGGPARSRRRPARAAGASSKPRHASPHQARRWLPAALTSRPGVFATASPPSPRSSETRLSAQSRPWGLAAAPATTRGPARPARRARPSAAGPRRRGRGVPRPDDRRRQGGRHGDADREAPAQAGPGALAQVDRDPVRGQQVSGSP